MTDREQLCKWFTELTGGHWHEWTMQRGGYNGCNCGVIFTDYNENIDYTNPADVLRVMMERDDFDDFLIIGLQKNHWLELEEFIENYIIEPDALLKAAVTFLKEERK